MEVDLKRIQELVDHPTESLSVELKRWFDPDQPEGIAKIIKTVLALRNHGGGYMVIGFNNETLEADSGKEPTPVRSVFHFDKIQGIVSKYSSELFEVAVHYPKRDGQEYPVIVVPSNVKTPVATKSKLCAGDKTLVKADTIYVRSLSANNTPSTTQAIWKDWSKITEVCFDNREADIGRFLRRHLSSLTPNLVREFFSAGSKETEDQSSIEELLRGFLQESKKRYEEVIRERHISPPEHGAWEVALGIIGDLPSHSANSEFLNLLSSSNPNYTGWPVWIINRGFRKKEDNPYVNKGIWEAFINNIGSDWGDDIDFMRLDPKGRFYLYRPLEDDISSSERAPKPMTELDFGLQVFRTAEAIAVGIEFAKALGCKPEKTQLAFAFRWSCLKGRRLSSWSEPGRFSSSSYYAYQDEVLSFVNVPLETPISALDAYVAQAVKPLFEVFDGYTIGKKAVEDYTRRLVERRL